MPVRQAELLAAGAAAGPVAEQQLLAAPGRVAPLLLNPLLPLFGRAVVGAVRLKPGVDVLPLQEAHALGAQRADDHPRVLARRLGALVRGVGAVVQAIGLAAAVAREGQEVCTPWWLVSWRCCVCMR